MVKNGGGGYSAFALAQALQKIHGHIYGYYALAIHKAGEADACIGQSRKRATMGDAINIGQSFSNGHGHNNMGLVNFINLHTTIFGKFIS